MKRLRAFAVATAEGELYQLCRENDEANTLAKYAAARSSDTYRVAELRELHVCVWKPLEDVAKRPRRRYDTACGRKSCLQDGTFCPHCSGKIATQE